MARPSEKEPGKNPLLALSRKAVAGWVVVVFIISAWMFGMGVMVGRGTAPVSFDMDQLKRTLESLQKSAQQAPRSGPRPEASEMKSKTDLGFYDSLPKNREDSEMPNLPKPPPAPARPEAPAQKPAAPPKVEKPAVASTPAPAAPPPAPAPAKEEKPKDEKAEPAAGKDKKEARYHKSYE